MSRVPEISGGHSATDSSFINGRDPKIKRMKLSLGFRNICYAGMMLIPNLTLIMSLVSGSAFATSTPPIKILRLSTSSKVETLDPAQADDFYSSLEAGRVYEGLLQYHYLKRPFELEPLLAEKMPEVTNGGKTYTFRIKTDVHFHPDSCLKIGENGLRSLRANDFVYSIKRFANPRDPSRLWYLFEGKIQGLNEWKDRQAKLPATNFDDPVEGLFAPDPRTLVITLTQPNPHFLWALAMTQVAAVPRECVEKYGPDFGSHAIGTGPFILENFNRDHKITYRKNPAYHGRYPTTGEKSDRAEGLLVDSGKSLPFADVVEVSYSAEWMPAWMNFQQGNLSLYPVPKDLMLNVVDEKGNLTSEYAKKGLKLHTAPSMHQYHFSFNMKDLLLGKNKLLRQAIFASIDREKFAQLFMPKRAIVGQSFIPLTSPDFDPKYRSPTTYSIDRAKKLLAQAGFPDGKGLPPLTFTGFTSTSARQQAEFFQNSLKAIGVPVQLEFVEWNDFQKRLENRTLQMWMMGMGADYPDAETAFVNFWGKNPSAMSNENAYSNPEFDALYEKMATMKPGAARRPLLKKLNAMLEEDAPQLIVANAIERTLTQPTLKNFKPNAFDLRTSKYWRVEFK